MKIVSKIQRKLHNLYWNTRSKLRKNSCLKNIIIFESSPDLSDNTKAVFDEMLRRSLNKQFKLVWFLYGSDNPIRSKIQNVLYLPHWDPRAKYYGKIAKAKICCNRFLEKESDNQLVFYLSHGTWLKNTRKQYKLPEWVDWCFAASPNLEESHAYNAVFSRSKTIGLGFPRNDKLLSHSNIDIQKLFGIDCKNIIIWYPTFRQHKSVNYSTVKNPIPLLHDISSAIKLNNIAISTNSIIIIKPHPVQDTQYIQEMNLSNIRFIDDSFFINNNIDSYEFIGTSNALITDYSSIYYDYTLCNRPIALIWEDIDSYKVSPGLIGNYEYMTKGGEKIYTLDELIDFVLRVSNGIDLLKSERTEIRDYVNYSTNSDNSLRVTSFILEKIKYI